MDKKEDVSAREVERKVERHTFKFPDREVDTQVIYCDHSDKVDADFIINSLKNLGVQDKTLFVEQGSSSIPDNGINWLKKLASERPDIDRDFKQRQEYTWSILDPGLDLSPYGIATDYVLEGNGVVVNMDLSTNFSPEAVKFLLDNVPLSYAVEFTYERAYGACFDMETTTPKVVQEILNLPLEEIQRYCNKIYSVYHKIPSQLDRRQEVRLFDNCLREQYIRQAIETNLEDNDVILAHPHHLKNVLKELKPHAVPLPKLLK